MINAIKKPLKKAFFSGIQAKNGVVTVHGGITWALETLGNLKHSKAYFFKPFRVPTTT
jgi:hypothetical protein